MKIKILEEINQLIKMEQLNIKIFHINKIPELKYSKKRLIT